MKILIIGLQRALNLLHLSINSFGSFSRDVDVKLVAHQGLEGRVSKRKNGEVATVTRYTTFFRHQKHQASYGKSRRRNGLRDRSSLRAKRSSFVKAGRRNGGR